LAVSENRKSKSGSKREQILSAAVEKFLEKDFYQVTVDEIAGLAGVGKGTVYEYFSSKEVLFKECFSYCTESYLQSFTQHLNDSVSVKTTMSAIVNAHLDLLKDNRKKLRLLFNERPLNFQELQSWVLDRRQELLLSIKSLLEEGIKNKEIKPGIDIEMAGRLFLALNYIVMGGMIIIDNVEVDEPQITNLLDIYFNGISLQEQG
jgi:AcrR family transcriptional regulator